MTKRTVRVSLTSLGDLTVQMHVAQRAATELTALGCRVIQVHCATFSDGPRVTIADPWPLLAHLDSQPEVHQPGTLREAAAQWHGVTVVWPVPTPKGARRA